MPYGIQYSPDAREHLRALSARDKRLVLDSVARQLQSEPAVETLDRKKMRPNPLAPWELRIGNLRVYYDIEEGPESTVWIDAIGVKKGNAVYIGGEKVDL